MDKYKLIETKYIKEIDSNVSVYRHIQTNARIITIKNDDNNKVFTIGFRTPPINDCGLTHILEHSVLCGSKKYPVKDPFVELIKSSLNTFLNAMTYPDKTVYPIASMNLKDFHNLMDVYLDAVFYPRIYDYKEIFMQEGWHYEILNEEDPIVYNGVVYNEMKGAFSDPNQILYRKIMHSLYPDSPYGLESGGDPKYIPELSYEDFLNFHSKYYHPSNSYIYLYGDLDMDAELKYLDEKYLSNFKFDGFDTKIKYQEPFKAPKSYDYYYQSDDLDKKAFLSYNVVFSNTDPKLLIATGILMDAIFNTPGAPVREALIKADIAADIDTAFDTELAQPMLIISATYADENKMEEFKQIIDTELKKLVDNGLDKNAILSLIKFVEFKVREKEFSSRMPQGLNVILASLGTYLYDENSPYSGLEPLKYFEELKEDLGNNYFENIIKDYILNNNHKTFVRLLPSIDCNKEEEKLVEKTLKEYKESLTKDELKTLIQMNKDLKNYQSTPDSDEALETLPKLKREDISILAEKYNLEVKNDKYPLLFSEYNTNEIGYFNFFFDVSNIDINTFKYATLYSALVFDIDTTNNSYLMINQQIQELTGGMYCNTTSYKNINDGTTSNKLTFVFSSLKENYKKSMDLMIDVINNSKFDDLVRIKEKLLEIKSSLDMLLLSRGNKTALGYAKALTDICAYYDENTNGVAFADFITDLIDNFDNKGEEIISNLKKINSLLSKKNFSFGFIGDKSYLNEINNDITSFYNSLVDELNYDKLVFNPVNKNTGLAAPINVSYNALVGKANYEFNGGMLALLNAINMQYLWFKVRVKGGAYGVSANVGQDGYISFASYRDPNVKNTYDAYNDVIDFIDNFNPTEDELLNYIIGAIANISPVLHVKSKGNIAFGDYFRGYGYEKRNKVRKELVEVSNKDFKEYKKAFIECLKNANICTLSADNKINADKNLFTEIRNIKK